MSDYATYLVHLTEVTGDTPNTSSEEIAKFLIVKHDFDTEHADGDTPLEMLSEITHTDSYESLYYYDYARDKIYSINYLLGKDQSYLPYIAEAISAEDLTEGVFVVCHFYDGGAGLFEVIEDALNKKYNE